ncbi:MAG: hypothetical protein HKO66_06245 [Saprospiraceae bacterium]|nr:hypothetical protein [Bacteroidia bacterium]NNE13729.1 hypothetical protein [Saprospiraceae bacterium]NNL91811.1 hypothetical protein [Saprospiraceae bacterium]
MLETLPNKLRDYKLHADVRTLLLLRKSMSKGLVKTLGDMYNVLKGIVVKDPEMMGPFTRAFYDYFLNIDIQNGERLNDAILRSETFRQWRDDIKERQKDFDLDDDQLVNRFLDEVHLTTYDIKKIISGKDIFENDDPNLEDDMGDESGEVRHKHLDKMADYSDLSLEELMERLKKIAEQQNSKHSGGSHWIGTGGISPFGHGGAAKDGIRIGGSGGGKMARKVINDRKYYPVDLDAIINDNNVDAALASLKGITEESAHEQLDVESTIKKGLKRGGLFIPEIKNILNEKLQVILLIDNGGYSMDPFIPMVQELFKKMKTRFAHDLETYYFHNTIYDRVFSDSRRFKPVFIDKILSKDKNYRIFIIGDAAMAPYELNSVSLRTYKKIRKKFKKTVWLNPEPTKYWHHTFTINLLRQMIDMYPLTPRGIEEAVRDMNAIN